MTLRKDEAAQPAIALAFRAVAFAWGMTALFVSGQAPPVPVGPSVVWTPDGTALQAIRDECGKGNSSAYQSCFIKGMQNRGASADAVAFARVLLKRSAGGPGYVTDFSKSGTVAALHVVFPLRANSNDAWLLVNGTPRLVDVDDFSLLPEPNLEANFAYKEIKRLFPSAMLSSGDRSASGPPLAPLPSGGQRFFINDVILNACHACAQLGNAQFTFDFDADGKFQGASLVGVWMAKEIGQPIAVATGQQFTVTLEAEHSTGFGWQLAAPPDAPDEKVAQFVATEYHQADAATAQKTGTAGIEVWTFRAVAAGQTLIRFRYVRTSDRDKPPARQYVFALTVQ